MVLSELSSSTCTIFVYTSLPQNGKYSLTFQRLVLNMACGLPYFPHPLLLSRVRGSDGSDKERDQSNFPLMKCYLNKPTVYRWLLYLTLIIITRNVGILICLQNKNTEYCHFGELWQFYNFQGSPRNCAEYIVRTYVYSKIPVFSYTHTQYIYASIYKYVCNQIQASLNRLTLLNLLNIQIPCSSGLNPPTWPCIVNISLGASKLLQFVAFLQLTTVASAGQESRYISFGKISSSLLTENT